jgi:acetate kinase
MIPLILVLNAGSSSLKAALFEVSTSGEVYLKIKGRIDRIQGQPLLTIQRDQQTQRPIEPFADKDQAINQAFNILYSEIEKEIENFIIVAVGHRVVHGGMLYDQATYVSGDVLERLKSFNTLAPQHQPYNLALIEKIARDEPDLVQVACFDTSFHAHQPEIARWFALPQQLTQEGIIRYGFHGLSYDYISQTMASVLGKEANGKIIIAHLGHGASMCALHHLKSVATTMGFSALEGLPMGKRSGSIDPGVIFYLVENKGLSIKEVEDILYNQSGLLGVSGISDDVQELLQNNSEGAKKAIEFFIYRIVREIGSLTYALQGLDHLIFTAGIGENAAPIRKGICEQLAWLGFHLDDEQNNSGGPQITKSGCFPSAWVIPTNEELIIAQQTARIWISRS